MSIYDDPNFELTHLRARYIQCFQDHIGLQIVRSDLNKPVPGFSDQRSSFAADEAFLRRECVSPELAINSDRASPIRTGIANNRTAFPDELIKSNKEIVDHDSNSPKAACGLSFHKKPLSITANSSRRASSAAQNQLKISELTSDRFANTDASNLEEVDWIGRSVAEKEPAITNLFIQKDASLRKDDDEVSENIWEENLGSSVVSSEPTTGFAGNGSESSPEGTTHVLFRDSVKDGSSEPDEESILGTKTDFQVQSEEIKTPPSVSHLWKLLHTSSTQTNTNPFTANYARFAGKGEPDHLDLTIYVFDLDGSDETIEKSIPIKIQVKSSATVAQVIGYTLYCSFEDRPELSIQDTQLKVSSWMLKIVEDDGIPDDDFPALDKNRPINRFYFDSYALVTSKAAEEFSKITSIDFSMTNNSPSNGTSHQNSIDVQHFFFTVFLDQCNLNEKATKIEVSREANISDILEKVCSKFSIDKSTYFLRVNGTKIVAPLNRPVDFLETDSKFDLVPKKILTLIPHINPGRSLPNTSIATESIENPTSADFAMNQASVFTKSTYERYNVWRRQPMSFMGRHERVLAIDGEYVQILPSEAKTYSDAPRTSSIHVSRIINAKQSRKIPTNFKILVAKVRETKRYDFEAQNQKEAALIISRIRALMNTEKSLQRP